MAMMDNMSGMDEEMRARYQELCDKEQSGMLNEAGRMELKDIRDSFGIME